MADLDVQPKKNRSVWLWIILAVIGLVILFFLLRGFNDNDTMDAADPVTTADTTVTTATPAYTRDWHSVDFNAAKTTYSEVSDRDIEVRGSDDYAIYSIDETVLFDSGQSEIRSGAEAKLKQISASVTQRFNDGEIRVYGHSDTKGSADTHKKLSEQRAEAVKNWFVQKSDLSDDKVSVHPVGESQLLASNETGSGGQQNRRIEIVARRSIRN